MERPAATTVTLRAVDAEGFAAWAETWRRVEAGVHAVQYSATHQWLSAWIAAYAPRRLTHVLVDDGAGPVAVGLLQHVAPRRLRFAGAPVSPRGGLLVADGRESAAWEAFAAGLARDLRGWSLLHCRGVPGAAAGLRRAVSSPAPEYAFELAPRFEDYLAGLSTAARKSMRQKLRRVAAVGEIVEAVPAEHPAALWRFVDLHRQRAEHQGEEHPDMDGRLRRLLLELPEHGTGIRLRVFELHVRDAVVATTLRLDHRATAFFYNGGFDPAHARLSPGICTQLASIRHAIDHGLGRFDLGPGHYRYKTELGGQPHMRYRVALGGPRVPTTAIALAQLLRGHARAR